MSDDQVSAQEGLRAKAYAFSVGQVVRTACELDIPDALAAGQATVTDLATATSTTESALVRLLRALVCCELVSEPTPGYFELTDEGALLCRDVAGSFRNRFLLFHGPGVTGPWGEMPYCVRTGNTAWPMLGYSDAFAYWSGDTERSTVFHGAMAEVSRDVSPAIARNCDFGRFAVVADLGGGDGTLLSRILLTYPAVEGVVFDTADGTRHASQVLAAAGVDARCWIVSGDFFDSVPSADAYLLKSVLHDWDFPTCVRILTNVRKAMAPGGRVLIVEQVMDGSPAVVLSDLNMMVAAGGAERTGNEYRELLDAAGFELLTVTRCEPTLFSVLEAEAVFT